MRCSIRFMCVCAIGVASLVGVSGCGSDGDSGPPTEFVAGDPVTVSGPSPFPECELNDAEVNEETEPWLAVNPTDADNIVGAWIQDLALGLVTAVSFDGGATWEPVVIPGISTCSTGNSANVTDPWLAFAADGALYSVGLSYTRGSPAARAIVVNRSVDGGRTWSAPVAVDAAAGNDKPSITADPEDPCSLYVGWSRFTGDTSLAGTVFFSRTTNCGESWAEPQALHSSDPAALFFQAVASPDGTVLAFFKETGFGPGTSRPFYVMRSTDAGATWPDGPTLIANVRQVSPSSPDTRQPIRSGRPGFDVAVDRRTGFLVATWEQLFTDDLLLPTQVAFSQSADGGLTWSDAVRIDGTPSSTAVTLEQAFLPSVEISDDGTVGVTYYNFQNDTPDQPPSWTDYWFVHCHPALGDCTEPASWSEGLRLTPEPFDYLLAPNVTTGSNRGLFLGDYVGLASSGSDFFALFSVTTADDPANAIFVPIRAQ